MRCRKARGNSPFLGSSWLASGRTSSTAKRRASACSATRSSVRYGGVNSGTGAVTTSSPITPPLGDKVRPVVVGDQFTVLVMDLGVPRHDSGARAARGLAHRLDGRSRRDGVTRMDGAMERALIDAEEGTSGLTQVLHAEADGGAEHEHRIHHDVGMAVGL